MNERVCGLLAFTGDRHVGVLMISESAAFLGRETYAPITELYVVPDRRSYDCPVGVVQQGVRLPRARRPSAGIGY